MLHHPRFQGQEHTPIPVQPGLWGHLALTAVTPVHVRGILTTMRDAGLSAKSIRTYVGTLAAIFNAAGEADLLPRTPHAASTSRPQDAGTDKRSLPRGSSSWPGPFPPGTER